VTHVAEVQNMEGEVIIMQDLFLFDYSMGVDENGNFRGSLKSMGIRPHFTDKLEDMGISLDTDLFQVEEFARVRVARR
jgi:pilus assembly protein CpaF